MVNKKIISPQDIVLFLWAYLYLVFLRFNKKSAFT